MKKADQTEYRIDRKCQVQLKVTVISQPYFNCSSGLPATRVCVHADYKALLSN